MNNQSGPPYRGTNSGDDTFDKFFGPGHDDPDRTDPGLPPPYQGETATGYQQEPLPGNGYYPQPPPPQRKRTAVIPLVVIAASLIVIAVVGWLVLRGSGSDTHAGPSPIQTSPPPTSGEQSDSSSPHGSSSSSTSTDSTSSSPAVTLPAPQSSCGSEQTFTTTPSVSCAFAARVYSTVQGSPPADGQSTTFQVRSLKNEGGSGLTYDVNCTHETGSYIQCVGVSSPDNGKRPTIYVMPTN